MTIACPPANAATPAMVLRTAAGSSEIADLIECLTKEGLRHYSAPRIESLVFDIEQVAAESAEYVGVDEVVTISRATADAAIAFVNVLPRSLPTPEIAPETDGEISFDWMGPFGKMFSVSIDSTGRLAYAGSFGSKSKVHGTEQLSNTCPPEIVQGISKALS